MVLGFVLYDSTCHGALTVFVEYLETASCLLPKPQPSFLLFCHWCHWKSRSWITDSSIPIKLSQKKDPPRWRGPILKSGRTSYLKSNASLKPNEKNSKNALRNWHLRDNEGLGSLDLFVQSVCHFGQVSSISGSWSGIVPVHVNIKRFLLG